MVSIPPDLRGQDRAAITLRVDYKRLNTFFSDYTKNISKGGTFIRTIKPLAVGTQFIFVLALPSGAGNIELLGEVMWIVHHGDASGEVDVEQAKDLGDDVEGMGIKFVFRTPSERTNVENFVESLMRETLGERLSSGLMKTARKAES